MTTDLPADPSGQSFSAITPSADSNLFGREDFRYEPDTNTYICPGEKTLRRKKIHRKDRYIVYEAAASDCGISSLKPRCTQAQKRSVSRHLYEEALNRMQERVTPAAMRLRRCTVEHPFATIKYRIFGHSGQQYPMAEAFGQEITMLYEAREQQHEARHLQSSLSPRRGPKLSNLSLERFRSSTRYQNRPAAADIAFCVAAFANGMTEDRIGCALEDDYLSRDPSPSKRAAYIREPWRRRGDGPGKEHRCRDSPYSETLPLLVKSSLKA
ncbi:transposase [Edaphobacter modestus]|uniref:transposase n=1 Tax=Edaphobacter modestus TaxID=388466 RepID=UPI00102C28C6|nr:transposase [Edaphobacter modestus]